MVTVNSRWVIIFLKITAFIALGQPAAAQPTFDTDWGGFYSLASPDEDLSPLYQYDHGLGQTFTFNFFGTDIDKMIWGGYRLGLGLTYQSLSGTQNPGRYPDPAYNYGPKEHTYSTFQLQLSVQTPLILQPQTKMVLNVKPGLIFSSRPTDENLLVLFPLLPTLGLQIGPSYYLGTNNQISVKLSFLYQYLLGLGGANYSPLRKGFTFSMGAQLKLPVHKTGMQNSH